MSASKTNESQSTSRYKELVDKIKLITKEDKLDALYKEYEDLDINASFGKEKETLLMMAAEKKNKDLVTALLQHPKINPNIQAYSGYTALHEAANYLDPELDKDVTAITEAILAHKDTDPNIKEKTGKTPLMVALTNGQANLGTGALAPLIAHKNIDLNCQDEDGNCALHYALKNHKEAAKLILKRADLNPNLRNNDGKTPLEITIDFQLSELITALLAHPNIDINARTSEGLTILNYASTKSLETSTFFGILNSPGVEINSKDKKGRTPLHNAAKGGAKKRKVNILNALLRHPETDVKSKDNDGNTALYHYVNSFKSIEELIRDSNLPHHDISPGVNFQQFNETINLFITKMELQGKELDEITALLPEGKDDFAKFIYEACNPEKTPVKASK